LAIDDLLTVLGEVRDEGVDVRIVGAALEDLRADRHLQRDIAAGLAGAVGAFAAGRRCRPRRVSGSGN
jgi:hypothetical protein